MPAAGDNHRAGPAAAEAADSRRAALAVEAAGNHPVPDEAGAAGTHREAPEAEAAGSHPEADSCRQEAVGAVGWSRFPFSEIHLIEAGGWQRRSLLDA